MDGSQPIRFLVILSTDEGGEVSNGEVRLARLAPAYYLFKDEGADVVLATLTGGYPKLPDFAQADQQDPSIRRFLDDRAARDDLADTLGVHQIVIDDFDAALCLGFSGPLWEDGNEGIALVLASLLDGGRPVVIIPGNAVPVSPRGAANGLLMIGEANDAPVMAAHALLKIVKERRKAKV